MTKLRYLLLALPLAGGDGGDEESGGELGAGASQERGRHDESSGVEGE